MGKMLTLRISILLFHLIVPAMGQQFMQPQAIQTPRVFQGPPFANRLETTRSMTSTVTPSTHNHSSTVSHLLQRTNPSTSSQLTKSITLTTLTTRSSLTQQGTTTRSGTVSTSKTNPLKFGTVKPAQRFADTTLNPTKIRPSTRSSQVTVAPLRSQTTLHSSSTRMHTTLSSSHARERSISTPSSRVTVVTTRSSTTSRSTTTASKAFPTLISNVITRSITTPASITSTRRSRPVVNPVTGVPLNQFRPTFQRKMEIHSVENASDPNFRNFAQQRRVGINNQGQVGPRVAVGPRLPQPQFIPQPTLRLQPPTQFIQQPTLRPQPPPQFVNRGQGLPARPNQRSPMRSMPPPGQQRPQQQVQAAQHPNLGPQAPMQRQFSQPQQVAPALMNRGPLPPPTMAPQQTTLSQGPRRVSSPRPSSLPPQTLPTSPPFSPTTSRLPPPSAPPRPLQITSQSNALQPVPTPPTAPLMSPRPRSPPGAHPPGVNPPSNSVVDELNQAQDFMAVAARLQLRRFHRQRRRRFAEFVERQIKSALNRMI